MFWVALERAIRLPTRPGPDWTVPYTNLYSSPEYALRRTRSSCSSGDDASRFEQAAAAGGQGSPAQLLAVVLAQVGASGKGLA